MAAFGGTLKLQTGFGYETTVAVAATGRVEVGGSNGFPADINGAGNHGVPADIKGAGNDGFPQRGQIRGLCIYCCQREGSS